MIRFSSSGRTSHVALWLLFWPFTDDFGPAGERENVSKVSSAKKKRTTSPTQSRSVPSDFLPFKVIFFLRSILCKKPVPAAGRTFSQYLIHFCPLSEAVIVNSFIKKYQTESAGLQDPSPVVSPPIYLNFPVLFYRPLYCRKSLH